MNKLDELEREVARLREALARFAVEAERYDPPEGDDNEAAWDTTFDIGDLRRARAAFTENNP